MNSGQKEEEDCEREILTSGANKSEREIYLKRLVGNKILVLKLRTWNRPLDKKEKKNRKMKVQR